MSKIEHFLEGVSGGIILLFVCFWVSVLLSVWQRYYRPDDRELFDMLKTFATGFGTAFLTMMNSRSQKKTEVTGNEPTVTINQTEAKPDTKPEEK